MRPADYAADNESPFAPDLHLDSGARRPAATDRLGILRDESLVPAFVDHCPGRFGAPVPSYVVPRWTARRIGLRSTTAATATE
jgi:hypothetical protein